MVSANDLRPGMAIRLEGMPFPAPGERVRIDVAAGRYVERARVERKR